MMSHHNKLFETAEIVLRKLYIIYNIPYTIYLPCQLPDNIFTDKREKKRGQETGEIHVHSCHRDILAPNFKNVSHASDRHVTDVITVMSRQSHVMSVVCLLYTVYRSDTSKHSWEFCLDYNRD